MIAWLVIWLIWLGVYGAGFGEQLGLRERQGIWGVALIILALAAHAGARQAIRQNLLFLRVGYVVIRQIVLDFVILLVILLLGPFVAVLFGVLIVWLWQALGGLAAASGIILFATIQMVVLLLHILPVQQERDR